MVPVGDTGSALEELNAFLAGHRVLDVQQQFYQNDRGAGWSFCIRYLQTAAGSSGPSKAKVDYREVLDADEFIRFARLRDLRRAIAQQEAIPAYAVFTDEELAGIAKLVEITVSSMGTVKGIGEKKAARYGQQIVNGMQQNA
jgi:superfamily II DNA helicase RecQ